VSCEWAEVSAAIERSPRVQAATPSAQYRASRQSTDKAQKEEAVCASLVRPRNG